MVDFVVSEVEYSVFEVLLGVENSAVGSFSSSDVVVVFVAGIHVKPDIKMLSLLKPMFSMDSSAPSSGQGGRVVEILD